MDIQRYLNTARVVIARLRPARVGLDKWQRAFQALMFIEVRGGAALAGTRQGRIVLVALRDSIDPETVGRLTVKRYHSQTALSEDGAFTHLHIKR